jgi:DNA-binding cell septation regulator SpoVG
MCEEKESLTLEEMFARHGIRVVQTPKGLRLAPGKREGLPHFPLHKQPKNND